jgi:hypothetical protein
LEKHLILVLKGRVSPMFLKKLQRRKSGKRHTYWALVESLRTAKGPRHRVVAYLGELAPHEEKGWARLAGKLDTKVLPVVEPTLFDTEDVTDRVPDRARVHIKGVRVEGTQDFGDVGLGLLLWRTLDLDELFRTLLPQGREEVPWHLLACLPVRRTQTGWSRRRGCPWVTRYSTGTDPM